MSNEVHLNVFMCCDVKGVVGLLACVRSIVRNTRTPERLSIHVLSHGCRARVLEGLESATSRSGVTVRVEDMTEHKHLVQHIDKFKPTEKYLNSYGNYGRFLIPLIFADIEEGLYMDSDMISLHDICNILHDIDKSMPLNAVRHSVGSFGLMRLDTLVNVSCEEQKKNVFNAGLYFMNCSHFRSNAMIDKVRHLISNQKSIGFVLGTQPILNALYYGQTHFLPLKWNVRCAAAYRLGMPLDDICILHWTGIPKPWESLQPEKNARKKQNLVNGKIVFGEIWDKYAS